MAAQQQQQQQNGPTAVLTRVLAPKMARRDFKLTLAEGVVGYFGPVAYSNDLVRIFGGIELEDGSRIYTLEKTVLPGAQWMKGAFVLRAGQLPAEHPQQAQYMHENYGPLAETDLANKSLETLLIDHFVERQRAMHPEIAESAWSYRPEMLT